MSASETSSLVREIQSALRSRSDIIVALLFGSLARGSARPDSDVDIAVVAPGLDRLTLRAELSAKLGRDVDIVSLDSVASIPLLEEVLRDGIVVHEREAGDAALFRSHALETDRPWFARMRDAWLRRVVERGIGW